jgi:2-oxoglutarate dehydrogenase E1 component
MGAWRFVREQFLDGCVPGAGARALRYVGRSPSASPAPGSHKVHVQEQDALLKEALG